MRQTGAPNGWGGRGGQVLQLLFVRVGAYSQDHYMVLLPKSPDGNQWHDLHHVYTFSTEHFELIWLMTMAL